MLEDLSWEVQCGKLRRFEKTRNKSLIQIPAERGIDEIFADVAGALDKM